MISYLVDLRTEKLEKIDTEEGFYSSELEAWKAYYEWFHQKGIWISEQLTLCQKQLNENGIKVHNALKEIDRLETHKTNIILK
jgi:hypothetical protein